MREKVWELDNEIHFKDTFRVFSKDEEGKDILRETRKVMTLLLSSEKTRRVRPILQDEVR
jgi:hypothetical protein